VDGGDVRVIQCRGGLGFLLEALPPVGDGGELGGQDLHGDLAVEP
jgi:hypothetical protein